MLGIHGGGSSVAGAFISLTILISLAGLENILAADIVFWPLQNEEDIYDISEND